MISMKILLLYLTKITGHDIIKKNQRRTYKKWIADALITFISGTTQAFFTAMSLFVVQKNKFHKAFDYESGYKNRCFL